MKLATWIRSSDREPGDIADELVVADETLRRYLVGTRIPTPRHMRRIFLLTQGAVTPNDFFDLDGLLPGWRGFAAPTPLAASDGGGVPCTACAAPGAPDMVPA